MRAEPEDLSGTSDSSDRGRSVAVYGCAEPTAQSGAGSLPAEITSVRRWMKTDDRVNAVSRLRLRAVTAGMAAIRCERIKKIGMNGQREGA